MLYEQLIAAPTSPRRSGIVDRDLVAGHPDLDSDHDIIVAARNLRQHRLVAVRPVGQRRDLAAQARLGAMDDLGPQRFQPVEPILFEQCLQSAAADVVGDELGADIAQHLVRHADVGAHEVEHGLVQPACVEQLEDGDLQPLLVHVLRFERRHAPAHVEVVDDAQGVADDAIAMKDRGGDGDVDQVAARNPGIVGDDDVTRLEAVGRVLRDEVAQHLGDDAEEPRGGDGRVGQHLRVGIEQGAAEVVILLHRRGIGRAHQPGRRLVDDRDQAVPQDLDGDRVELHRSHPPERGRDGRVAGLDGRGRPVDGQFDHEATEGIH